MEINDRLINRLRKIEGQVKGIQRMVSDNQNCDDVLIQIAAVRSALNSVAGIVLENHMKVCLKDYTDNNEEVLDNLISSIIKYTKRN